MASLLKSTLKTLLRGPFTRRYPKVAREPFAGSRGQLVIDANACIYCTLCAKRCPSNALAVSREAKTWTFDPYRCIVCGYCVEACPKKCLSMRNEHFKP